MKSSGYYKVGVRRIVARQRAILMRGCAFIGAFMLAVFMTEAAFCDGRGTAEDALEREGERVMVNPHDASSQRSLCSVCHTAKPPALSFDAVTTCVKCHAANVDNHPVSRHPIGAVPRIRVPSFFPLTPDGRMVCYTCHDPHKKPDGERQKMLRVDYHALCASCHVGY